MCNFWGFIKYVRCENIKKSFHRFCNSCLYNGVKMNYFCITYETGNVYLCIQDRRGELESLDLAVERQKASLTAMKEAEKVLKMERESARSQLEALRRSNKDRGARRKYVIFKKN